MCSALVSFDNTLFESYGKTDAATRWSAGISDAVTTGFNTAVIKRAARAPIVALTKMTTLGLLGIAITGSFVTTLPLERTAVTEISDVGQSAPALQDFMEAKAALADLLTMDDGWDGSSSKAPSPIAIQNALEFLGQIPQTMTLPEVSAAADGFVGLYWDHEDRHAGVVFTDVGDLVYFAKSGDSVLARGKFRFSGTVPETLLGAITDV